MEKTSKNSIMHYVANLSIMCRKLYFVKHNVLMIAKNIVSIQ